MRVEQFIYEPRRNVGICYEQTPDLSKILSEDKLVELYNLGGNSRIEQKLPLLHYVKGDYVISLTHVTPMQDDKKRQSIRNHTLIFRLSDMLNLLFPLLNQPVESPIQPIEIKSLEIEPLKVKTQ